MIPRHLRVALVAMLALVGVVPFSAMAHSASTAYLQVSSQGNGSQAVQWRVALRDLDALVDLDLDADGKLTWGEVEDRQQELGQLMRSALVFSNAEGACNVGTPVITYLAIVGAGHAQMSAPLSCAAGIAAASMSYHLFVASIRRTGCSFSSTTRAHRARSRRAGALLSMRPPCRPIRDFLASSPMALATSCADSITCCSSLR